MNIEIFPSREVALILGQFSIHWYGLMYVCAFLVGSKILERTLHHRGIVLSSSALDNFLVAVILGVLLGGRLGYVLFYDPAYFAQHPLEIFAVWNGGMASHGGFIGVTIALIIWTKKNSVDLWKIADVLVIPVAIGLAFGRIGNFINQELYGTITSLPWGMHFPGAEGTRHPVQLYAALKDIILASLLYLHLVRTSAVRGTYTSGVTASLFLIGYGILRFFVEIFREQPLGFTRILELELSRGQLLTIPIILLGFILLFLRIRASRAPAR